MKSKKSKPGSKSVKSLGSRELLDGYNRQARGLPPRRNFKEKETTAEFHARQEDQKNKHAEIDKRVAKGDRYLDQYASDAVKEHAAAYPPPLLKKSELTLEKALKLRKDKLRAELKRAEGHRAFIRSTYPNPQEIKDQFDRLTVEAHNARDEREIRTIRHAMLRKGMTAPGNVVRSPIPAVAGPAKVNQIQVLHVHVADPFAPTRNQPQAEAPPAPSSASPTSPTLPAESLMDGRPNAVQRGERFNKPYEELKAIEKSARASGHSGEQLRADFPSLSIWQEVDKSAMSEQEKRQFPDFSHYGSKHCHAMLGRVFGCSASTVKTYLGKYGTWKRMKQ